MPLANKYGMRDYQNPIVATVNMLESDESLPDDDPETRNGGLKPSRQSDLQQIQMYMKLRQSGRISDKAWARLIQRNPESAVIFSTIGPDPEALAEKRRKEILSEYYAPGGQQPMGPPTPEGVYGAPTNVKPRKDTESAVLALLQSGDIEGAKSLLGVVDQRSGSKARPMQIQTVDDKGNPTTVIVDPETLEKVREYPMVPKALAGQDIDKISDAASVADAFGGLNSDFQDEFGGYKSGAFGEASREYQSRFGQDPSQMVDWWQRYQDQKNRVRNKLFGSALTETEAREFDKANVHPGMKPAQIRANLARQAAVSKRGLDRLTKSYGPRYDTRQIQGASERTPANTPSGSAPVKRLKYNPATGKIE